MEKICLSFYRKTLITLCFFSVGFLLAGDLHYDLTEYSEQPKIKAVVSGDFLDVTWEGREKTQLRLQLTIEQGAPVLKELAVRSDGHNWRTICNDVTPEYRVVSGVRRVTQQQTEPLVEMGIPLTDSLLNKIKWDAFWDAPLYITDEPPKKRQSSIPAAEPFANHPGMPRKAEEVVRAKAEFSVDSCIVRTNGVRLEIVFPGVTAGIFTGYLQYDIYKGCNLIRQMFVAKTEHPSAAFKYDAGLTGLRSDRKSGVIWRDPDGRWQGFSIDGPANLNAVTVTGRNRLIAAESEKASIAAFPPPHSFYWARESEENLGYGWYRKDSDTSFSFGIRQAETEKNPEFYENFALYSARPGRWQRMPVFFLISDGPGRQAIDSALRYTNGDRYRPIPGYKVMGHHYHTGLVKRLKKMGEGAILNDVRSMKDIGIDIFSVIDGVRGPGRHDKGELFLKDLMRPQEVSQTANFWSYPMMRTVQGEDLPSWGGITIF